MGINNNIGYSNNVEGIPFAASVINKFGENPDIDTGSVPETIWAHGGVFNFLDAEIDMDIVSSDGDDITAGTGAQTIRVFGYSELNIEIIEDIPLNGATRVELANKYKIITRAKVLLSGASNTNEGEVNIVDRATGAIVYQSIEIGEGQTLSAVQICPANKTGIVKMHYCTYSREANRDGARLRLRLRAIDGSILTKYNVTISTDNPWNERRYEQGGIEVTEGEVVFWECVSVTASNTPIEAGFDIVFEDVIS